MRRAFLVSLLLLIGCLAAPVDSKGFDDMSSVYTGDATNLSLPLSAVENALPDDGDDLTAASVGVAFEGIDDTLDHLCEWTGEAKYGVDETRHWAPTLMSGFNVSQDFVYGLATPTPTQALEGGTAWFALDLPDGARTATFFVVLRGSAGHGALPAQKPRVKVYSYNTVTGTATQLGSTATDPSGSVVAFETLHEIDVSATTTIDRTSKFFYIEVLGESGANWQSGLEIHSIGAQYHVNAIDPLL